MDATVTQRSHWFHPLIVLPMLVGGTAGAVGGALLLGNTFATLLVWIVGITGRQNILWNWGIPVLVVFALVILTTVCFCYSGWLLIGTPRPNEVLPPVALVAMIIPLLTAIVLAIAIFEGPFTLLGVNSRWITEPLKATGVPWVWLDGHDLPIPTFLKLCLFGYLTFPFLVLNEDKHFARDA